MEETRRALGRLNLLKNQIAPTPTAGSLPAKSGDDVVIVAMARTAMTKAKKGGFRDTAVEAMLGAVLKAVVEESKIDASLIEDICVGNVLAPGAGATTSRMAGFLAGIPETAGLSAVNRQCSSGLQAVMNIVNAIRGGQIDIGIGSGVENMSQYSFNDAIRPDLISDQVYEHETARNCLIPMGITSENVAARYGVTREEQDAFAAESQRRACEAQKNGLLPGEITPVKSFVNNEDGTQTEIVVDKDDGMREGTTADKLAKLKPAFQKGGSTTAGNSSQVTDGAAAVLLARRSVAERLGLPIRGRVVSYAVAGVPPDVMGIGPAFAIPAALKKAGLTVDDIDVFEVNEAFASQCLYSAKHLKIDLKKLNPRGGAIALGHPLGATGARQIKTLFSELERTQKRFGVVSMCIGTGMGAAGVFERE
uniref:acetyl-CoA C-acyltransferase n=1 Tax=Euplotes harpa TaxID=151035 RepID=A0A7S3JL91_9SPIT